MPPATYFSTDFQVKTNGIKEAFVWKTRRLCCVFELFGINQRPGGLYEVLWEKRPEPVGSLSGVITENGQVMFRFKHFRAW